MGGPTAEHNDRRPHLRRKARRLLAALSAKEREGLLVRCWISHDARWYTAVARAFGIDAANKLNQFAARETGKIEAVRITRALGLAPVVTLDDYAVVHEVLIGLLGPDLIDYELLAAGDGAWEFRVRRCFAHENVMRAGIGEEYECGVFARVTGWMEALGLNCEMTPALAGCARAQGRECRYRFKLRDGIQPT
ncbi:MAG TPA: DUF6125 family protein [Syntrophobacteraceae bacterium]|nr:DUF6125 family protein [Syntrophobacteraceae bacterium]